MASSKELLQLEESDGYLFHGSGVRLEELEPRQAHTIVNGEHVPDGPPAIFASPHSQYAIFMAIINHINCPQGSRSGVSSDVDGLVFTATQKTLDQLDENSKGYVHVFSRDGFQPRSNSEWRSLAPVKPVQIIEICIEDLPQPITVIPEGS